MSHMCVAIRVLPSVRNGLAPSRTFSWETLVANGTFDESPRSVAPWCNNGPSNHNTYRAHQQHTRMIIHFRRSVECFCISIEMKRQGNMRHSLLRIIPTPGNSSTYCLCSMKQTRNWNIKEKGEKVWHNTQLTLTCNCRIPATLFHAF